MQIVACPCASDSLGIGGAMKAKVTLLARVKEAKSFSWVPVRIARRAIVIPVEKADGRICSIPIQAKATRRKPRILYGDVFAHMRAFFVATAEATF